MKQLLTTILFTILIFLNIKAQTTEINHKDSNNIDKYGFVCGSTNDFFNSFIGTSDTNSNASYAIMSSFPPSKIIQCGLFDLYYSDLLLTSNKGGFADTTIVSGTLTLGEQRRQTLCAVLGYIEHTLDFSRVAMSGRRIRLIIDTSYFPSSSPTTSSPIGTTFYAQASSFHQASSIGYIKGFTADFITTGIDPININAFHGYMKVNFDAATVFGIRKAINWHNSTDKLTNPTGNCKIDLYTALLHEMGHVLGFMSFINFKNYDNPAMQSGTYKPAKSTTGIYSFLDSAIQVAKIPNPIFPINHPLFTGTVLNDTFSYLANGNYYLYDTIAENNVLVYSGNGRPLGNSPGSFISHIDDGNSKYKTPERICPGTYQDFVMGPFGYEGVMRRVFTKAEVKIFKNILGYGYNTSTPPYSNSINNVPPYSTKMASKKYNDLCFISGQYFDNPYNPFSTTTFETTTSPREIAELLPVDAVLKNDSGSYYDYDIRLDSTIRDVNGDSLYITDSTIINYRGCSNGGNNHNLLTLINNHTIRYTPRHNYYGRTQFGFNINDGKEKGSFVIFTINVKRGNNVNASVGENIVLNGDFEFGSEVRTKGLDENKNYSTLDENGYQVTPFYGNIFSDCHPYITCSNPWFPYGAGILIKNSYLNCNVADSLTRVTGDFENDYSLQIAPMLPTAGNRCQSFMFSGRGSLYNLATDLEKCKHYTLEFDAHLMNSSFSPYYNVPLELGFTNDSTLYSKNIVLETYHITPTIDKDTAVRSLVDTLRPYKQVSLNKTTWQHFSITIEYCKNVKSNILYIGNRMPYNARNNFAIDNISLKETAPNFSVVITNPKTSLLKSNLAYNVDYHCNNLTYEWTSSTTGATILGTSDSLNLSVITTPTIFTLKVNDGCFIMQDTIVLGGCIPPSTSPITGTTHHLCLNDSTKLNNATIGGIWSSSNINIASVSNDGWVKAKTIGIDTIFYTVSSGGCVAKESYIITAHGKPIVTITTVKDTVAVCYNNQSLILTANVSGTADTVINYNWGSPILGAISTTINTYTETNINGLGYGSFSYFLDVSTNYCAGQADAKEIILQPCYITCAVCNVDIPAIVDVNSTFSFDTYCNNNQDIIVKSGAMMNLQDAELVMSANSSITVEQGATLNIIGSHIYSCDEMWKGIVVENGGTLNIVGSATRTSFIEDALIAADFNIERIPSSAYYNNPILLVDNAIFNRNQTSIHFNSIVGSFNPALISIGNCLFTSRRIPFSGLNWDNLSAVKHKATTPAFVYPATPLSFDNPYINETAYPDDGFASYLKLPFAQGTIKPSYGVDINDAYFDETIKLTIGNAVGDSFITGTSIFDNIDIGINAHNSNLIVNNCTFQKANPNDITPLPNVNGVGVFATNNSHRTVEINTVGSTPNNAFYNLNTAIQIDGSKEILINNCDIRSNQSSSFTTAKGGMGIYIGSPYFNEVNVTNNKLYNIKNAIWFLAGISSNQTGYYGQLNITNNAIADTLLGVPVVGNEFVENAITIEAINGSSDNVQTVNCQNNKIKNVYNGIKVSNWKGKDTHIDFNEIGLKNNPNATNSNLSYGIKIESGEAHPVEPTYDPVTDEPIIDQNYYGNTVINNMVSGTGDNEKQVAIDALLQANTHFGCNMVSNAVHGFRFSGDNPNTRFWNNQIDLSNKYGYTLNQAIIGEQGVRSYKGILGCTSDNIWVGKNTQWATLGHYKTYALASYATDSRLIILNKSSYNPNGSGLGSIFGGFPYPAYSKQSTYAASGIWYNSLLPDDVTCGRCNALGIPRPMDGSEVDSTLEAIADGTIGVPSEDSAQRRYVMQQQLFELIYRNPDILNQSSSLQSFVQNNQWTGLDFIHYTGKFLAEGNMNMVDLLLGFWPNTAAELDSNYYQYFNWLTDMYYDSTWLPNETEVLTLANKCPLVSGNVVFAARNLYNSITGRINSFNECENVEDYASRAVAAPQQPELPHNETIQVFPNPTTGIVNIKLPHNEKGCWRIIVTNILGKPILEKQVAPRQSLTSLTLNGSKGMYFINIYNCATGRQSTMKVLLK